MKTGTLQLEKGFPLMKTGFYLWELAHREFPVSYAGFGFVVCNVIESEIKRENIHMKPPTMFLPGTLGHN